MQHPFKIFILSGVLLTASVVASAQPRPHHRPPVHRKHRVHHVHHGVRHRAHHPLPPHR